MDNEEDLMELIPGLPEEVGVECLSRVHYSAHGVASRVCRGWRNLVLSKDFYYHRKQRGFTYKAACLVQALPTCHSSDSKHAGQPRYGISLFDPVTQGWDRVDPIPKYPEGLPMFCQVASTQGKLVLMGGWDPSSWEPVRDVFLYDFTTRRWTQCADMPSIRSLFAIGAVEGKVMVAGGHDESKNALNSAWILDVNKNEWVELGRMSEERDECEGVVMEEEFWVVSGYATETQGAFTNTADVYDIGSGQWRRVEGAWEVSRCPRSCVGKKKNNNNNSLIICCWADVDSAVQVGACGVDLGDDCALVTGSPYQGAPHGFYLSQPQNPKFINITVPNDYAGFVQSGCTLEI